MGKRERGFGLAFIGTAVGGVRVSLAAPAPGEGRGRSDGGGGGMWRVAAGARAVGDLHTLTKPMSAAFSRKH